ncbi:type II secretion system minor pseudopilin GspH [Erwinia sp. HDF1-3R]|uniref:type II secretion system minor pseudopilin GspH n=1 Tax=Erwinia sp. HDF1-3R TaxID=3141543 RepID=UPI0031F49066
MITRSQGFTLLEMLCVLFLLGLMGSLVTGAFPSPHREMAREHEKILLALRTTAERAQLEGRVYGLQIRPGGWDIRVLSRDTEPAELRQSGALIDGYHWRIAKRGSKTLQYRLPPQVVLKIEVNRVSYSSVGEKGGDDKPQVLFLPGGEVTDFVLSTSMRQASDDRDRQANGAAAGGFITSSAQFLLSEGESCERKRNGTDGSAGGDAYSGYLSDCGVENQRTTGKGSH